MTDGPSAALAGKGRAPGEAQLCSCVRARSHGVGAPAAELRAREARGAEPEGHGDQPTGAVEAPDAFPMTRRRGRRSPARARGCDPIPRRGAGRLLRAHCQPSRSTSQAGAQSPRRTTHPGG